MTRQYLRYAVPVGQRFVGKQQNKLEFECKRNGTVHRRITIYPDKDKIIVEEFELTYDVKTDSYHMKITHCNIHDKFSYAKSEFVGRMCSAAYEMGNNESDGSLGTIFEGK